MMTGAKLKAWRTRAGLSQASIAATLGVHKRTVSKWECGVHRIPDAVALALRALRKGGA